MPDFRLRKMMLFSETIHHENGPPPATPRRRAAIVAVVANPFAGTWQEDLQSAMDDLKPLGLQMTDELISALGGADGIDGYGKAALAGAGALTGYVVGRRGPAALAVHGRAAPVSDGSATSGFQAAQQGFTGFPGCIEADFCNQILIGKR